MRIGNRGVERTGQPFEFTFEGRRVGAWAGESLAAALINADIWGLRETRGGARRGLFCGMGVCGECAVTVDGVQRRACLEPARAGIEVRRMRGLASPRATPPDIGRAEHLTPDVMILGAGPAGLAAARITGEAGLDVLVVDERAKAGGQFYKQPGKGFAVDGGTIDRQFAEGRTLIAAAEGAGVRFLFGATLWSAGPGPAFRVAHEGRSISIAPRRAILCPGAYERPHSVPGWTLPGVMTTGAAQTLLRAYQTAPGRRILVAGNGPLNLQVARELVRAGATVVALAELALPPWRASPVDLLRMAASAPRLVLEGLGHLTALRSAGVAPAYRHVLTRAEGDEKVRRAFVARIDGEGRIVSGSERDFDVDSICMGYGFLPQAEIARATGCAHDVDPMTGGLVAVRDEFGRSSVADIFIAGDAGGLGGARIAEAQGTLAGIAASRDLGAFVDAAATRATRRAREVVRRHRRFQAALWRIHAAPAPHPALFERGLLCRCEEVERGTAAEQLATGLSSLGAVKRASRIGMGPCQGRYCGVALAEMLAARTGNPTEPDGFFAPRTPFKPVPIATLAQADESSQCEL